MKLFMPTSYGQKPTIRDMESSFTAELNGNNADNIGRLFCAAPELLEVLENVHKTMQRVITKAKTGG